jgi:putative ABC transport system permease protein
MGAAWQSLSSHWLRSFLTMLGVVIGVAAVIVLVAFGEGAQREITSQIDTLGSNVAVVIPGKAQGQKNFNPLGSLGLSNLTPADLEVLRRTPKVVAVAPLAFVGGGVYRGEQPAGMCMPLGVTPEFFGVRRLKLSMGRFFTAAEAGSQVCVIGSGLQRDLFPTEAPVGKKLSVNNREYEILGVIGERSIGSGVFGGEELDSIVYLPLDHIQRATLSRQVHRIFVEIQAGTDPATMLESLRQAILRAHGNRDDFTVMGARELLGIFYKVFSLLGALLLGITSISLVVGGIGIMNMMLVTVTERTVEIGIRKTVGARRRDIFFQFLTEAVALSALGGLVGVLLAVVVCALFPLWLPLRPIITASSVALGFGVCVLVGVVSGVAPAVSAARLDPIVAIRRE